MSLSQFDINSLNGKKINLLKHENFLVRNGAASYSLKSIGPGLFNTMRPVVLSRSTNTACIGETFMDCLVVTKSIAVEENVDVDIAVSGFIFIL
jgi:hypothetical protein